MTGGGADVDCLLLCWAWAGKGGERPVSSVAPAKRDGLRPNFNNGYGAKPAGACHVSMYTKPLNPRSDEPASYRHMSRQGPATEPRTLVG